MRSNRFELSQFRGRQSTLMVNSTNQPSELVQTLTAMITTLERFWSQSQLCGLLLTRRGRPVSQTEVTGIRIPYLVLFRDSAGTMQRCAPRLGIQTFSFATT